MTDNAETGGLHIDSDWKTEAAQEKKRLTEQEAATKGTPGAEPPASFAELVNILAMQAAIALGGYQGPGGDRIPANPVSAKHYIDLMEVIQQKTDGNLTDEEKKMLDAVTHELRMQYVQVVAPLPPADAEKK